jgi:hypothetical protein
VLQWYTKWIFKNISLESSIGGDNATIGSSTGTGAETAGIGSFKLKLFLHLEQTS